MSKIPFTVDSNTARLIGNENVSKLDGAIFELVKNSYDADATTCIVYFDDKTSTLYLADNGIGMTKSIIENHWMTIGYSEKVKNFHSPSGRIATGAKGIGRFALDRIAKACSMYTVTRGSRLVWSVYWDDFLPGKKINEVFANLESVEQNYTEFSKDSSNSLFLELLSKNFKTGTIFKLNKLNDSWNKSTIENIRKYLSSLMPPNISESFKLYFLDNSTDNESSALSTNNDNFEYDYKISFKVNKAGKARISIFRNEFDFKAKEKEILKGAEFSQSDEKYFNGSPIELNKTLSHMFGLKEGENPIGEFSGELYFSKIRRASKGIRERFYYKDFLTARNYSEDFGGIKIYRDNFRVRPYGDPNSSGYDWLLLSNRRSKQPAGIAHPTGAWRVDSGQIIGSVFISRLITSLKDQANREGIMESKEFSLFRRFIIQVIQEFEKDRQYVCRKLDAYYKLSHPTEKIEKEIKEKSRIAESENSSGNAISDSTKNSVSASDAQKVIDSKETKIRDLEDENRILKILATTGILANQYMHEIKAIAHNLSLKIINAKECLEIDNDPIGAYESIEGANTLRKSFSSWFEVTLDSITKDKRKRINVNIEESINSLMAAWRHAFKNREELNFTFNMKSNEKMFRCYESDIELIINNLIANSISSFESNPVPQQNIIINAQIVEKNLLIEYSDNGIGLSTAYKENPSAILEAFESNKCDDNGNIIGTGMGMWIINSTINNYKGMIDLNENTKEKNGFHISFGLKSF